MTNRAFTNEFFVSLALTSVAAHIKTMGGFLFKTESIRKLSNFDFQWTKILYQNNLKNIAFFFTLRTKNAINHL